MKQCVTVRYLTGFISLYSGQMQTSPRQKNQLSGNLVAAGSTSPIPFKLGLTWTLMQIFTIVREQSDKNKEREAPKPQYVTGGLKALIVGSSVLTYLWIITLHGWARSNITCNVSQCCACVSSHNSNYDTDCRHTHSCWPAVCDTHTCIMSQAQTAIYRFSYNTAMTLCNLRFVWFTL